MFGLRPIYSLPTTELGPARFEKTSLSSPILWPTIFFHHGFSPASVASGSHDKNTVGIKDHLQQPTIRPSHACNAQCQMIADEVQPPTALSIFRDQTSLTVTESSQPFNKLIATFLGGGVPLSPRGVMHWRSDWPPASYRPITMARKRTEKTCGWPSLT